MLHAFSSKRALSAALLAVIATASQANPFVETFGSSQTRQRSQYVPQFAASGAVSYYRFADPQGSANERLVNDGHYAVIDPSQIIPTGGGSWWENNTIGRAADLRDHTGAGAPGGSVLVVNAGNTTNALYRRIATLQPNTTYTLSAWRFIVAGPTNLSFEIREADDTRQLSLSPETTTPDAGTQAGQWTRLSWTFRTGNCAVAQYAVNVKNNSPVVTGNDLFLDDISLQPDQLGLVQSNVPCSTTTVPTVTAANDSGSTPPGQPLTINLVANDSSSNATTAPLGTPTQGDVTAQHGTVVFNPDGTARYTPTAGYNGIDTFNYNVCTVASAQNPSPTCGTASVTVNVAAVSAQPASVPTLSQWGLIVLSALLAMFGLRRTTRQH